MSTVTNVRGLRCRACGESAPIAANHVCFSCFGPLEVVYEDVEVTREQIAAGPPTLWRYAALLPVLDPAAIDPGLGAGWTPLVAAPRLAERIGLDELWLKDDTRNPTGSFKDRVVAVASAAARALEIDTLACASTGNLANAVAAAAARSGVPAYVFIPHDLERAKIITSAVYGANVVAVRGTYDEVNRLCAELADDRGWGFVNVNLRPFYAEGSRSLGFEIAEQLGWNPPDHVVVPVASGAQLVKVHEAFGELRRRSLIDDHPVRVSGAQAAGCAPVATAFAEGASDVRPVRPDTIARSLAIGDPADGPYALAAVRSTGGSIAAVGDAEIVEGIQLLAETTGIFAETAGGVTVATLAKLVREGRIHRSERVVAIISGNGLKTVEALSDVARPSMEIPPSLDAFDAAADQARVPVSTGA